MADPARAAAVLRGLDSLGVTLSLDDFGTGYSSLSRLRDLPISEIKIDRSFAARIEIDERDVAILRTAIELGHNLGCSVVAEGLETASALSRVTSLGCDTGQGFHIARPLDAGRLTAWLEDRSQGGERDASRTPRRTSRPAALNRGSALRGQVRPERASRTSVTASGKTVAITARICSACSAVVPWTLTRLIAATVMSTASLIALSAQASDCWLWNCSANSAIRRWSSSGSPNRPPKPSMVQS